MSCVNFYAEIVLNFNSDLTHLFLYFVKRLRNNYFKIFILNFEDVCKIFFSFYIYLFLGVFKGVSRLYMIGSYVPGFVPKLLVSLSLVLLSCHFSSDRLNHFCFFFIAAWHPHIQLAVWHYSSVL